ncbi:helix-turn-helix domain-containing protein [Stenotrophomonas maltophilia]|uniref:helix-turn-helix domain-containing protein n=1 Tax=Stenotrophomonas maltophilia TaxID=40324 RepID=UPI003CCEBD04
MCSDSQISMPFPSTQPDARGRFGTRLRSARKTAGLTQQQLGIEIGLEIDVAATRINRYERGVHDPDSATAQQLADRLGMPLAYFYSDNDALAEAILMFAGLSPDQQKEALEALKLVASRASTGD